MVDYDKLYDEYRRIPCGALVHGMDGHLYVKPSDPDNLDHLDETLIQVGTGMVVHFSVVGPLRDITDNIYPEEERHGTAE